MSKIQRLSEQLISQIAAGEVIERPASAVKELLENSLDAGASEIVVELEEGGMNMIRVVDNGAGMSAEDAALALERHATSKIQNLDDLFNIQTLGFRGEALASMASVAMVVLVSCAQGERLGTRVEVDGGKWISQDAASCPVGTDISIIGLFKHTPARRKYMKTPQTEFQYCSDFITEAALAHPQIGFRLIRDGKEVFHLPKGQTLLERVKHLYGPETAQALIPVEYHQSNLLLNGFVGKPELSRSNRRYQFLFVNGRPIESRLLQHAVKEAFHSLLMHEKYPWFLLNMEIDPAFVDVNVHPRKLEVKFVNQQEVYRAVHGAVKHALEKQLLSPVMEQTPSKPEALSFDLPERERPLDAVRPIQNQASFELKTLKLRPVAQIAHSYIVAESEDGLVLIDQHAAHERVRYARFMAALDAEKAPIQPLLTPLELDLGSEGAQLLETHLEEFNQLGFEIEPFGGHSFLIRSVPAGLTKKEPERIVREILNDLTQQWKGNAPKNVREEMVTMAACRGAIKFGDPLMMSEMEALLRDMEDTENCTHCPHGRPALLTIPFGELETLFKRKNF